MAEALHRNTVSKAIAAALENRGYRQMSQNIYLKELDEEVSAWVGLPTDRASAHVLEVTPMVGVRHGSIHSIVDPITGLDSTGVATLGEPLTELMPAEYEDGVWSFENGGPIDSVAEHLAESIVRFGEPYMKRHMTLEAIIETLSTSWPWEYSQVRIPAALILLERKEEAARFIAAELEKQSERTDPAAEFYRGFAERFRETYLAD